MQFVYATPCCIGLLEFAFKKVVHIKNMTIKFITIVYSYIIDLLPWYVKCSLCTNAMQNEKLRNKKGNSW